MNKLFKSARLNKDDVVKKSIVDQLSNTVKELQYSGLKENTSSNVVDSKEAANQLCVITEAIFLHGLKDKLTYKFKRALGDVDSKPEPSFWAPLLVISHRQIIDQILSLSQITTETGQCRAWIRQALNDCLLSSYLLTLKQDQSVSRNFYNTGAFLRDTELLDVAQRLIEGFECFKTVTLPCNSSLLNDWLPASLYLAGIWAPTLKACPVAPCDDVAQSIEAQKIPDNSSETNSLCSAMSITSQTSSFRQMMSFSEDEVLKIILSKGESIQNQNLNLKNQNQNAEENVEPVEGAKVVGNSISIASGSGWSSGGENKELVRDVRVDEVKIVEPTTSMENSFDALVDSYNIISGDYIRTPNLKDVWQKIDDMHVHVEVEPQYKKIIVQPAIVPEVKTEPKPLCDLLGEICREKGMDKQNFECLGCATPFIAYQKFNVCAFSGDYYCDGCMSGTDSAIPARIVHNWDFNLYPVSRKSYDYIEEIKDQPLIDFKVLNPYIYSVVVEMSEVQVLRNQLNYLRAYLYTCREPIIGELQKLMYPREYMYEHVHRYSFNDLLGIPSRVLAATLQRGVDFGKEHVTACWLCSQKGFVCEICDKPENKPKTIFPFDVENVHRCNHCNGVYHKHCLTTRKPCPKCKRKKGRSDLSNLLDSTE